MKPEQTATGQALNTASAGGAQQQQQQQPKLYSKALQGSASGQNMGPGGANAGGPYHNKSGGSRYNNSSHSRGPRTGPSGGGGGGAYPPRHNQSYNSRSSTNSNQTSGGNSSATSAISPPVTNVPTSANSNVSGGGGGGGAGAAVAPPNANGSITPTENGKQIASTNEASLPAAQSTTGTINGSATSNGALNVAGGGGGGEAKSHMGLLGDGHAGPHHHERERSHGTGDRYGGGRHSGGDLHSSQGISKTNLYIRGLTPDTTDTDLRALCAPYGNIISTKAILDKETGKCRGYGFVDFEFPISAETAVKNLAAQGVQAQMAKCSDVGRNKGAAPGSSTSFGSAHKDRSGSSAGLGGGGGGYYSNERGASNYGGQGLNGDQWSDQALEHDPTNLYIANLPLSLTEMDLEKMLLVYGSVVSTRILKDVNGFSRGVGFARMETKEKCEEIIQILNSKKIAGSNDPLLVKFADGGSKKKHYKNDNDGARVGGGGRYRSDVDQMAMQFDATNMATNGGVPPQMLPSGLGPNYQRVFSAPMTGGMAQNASNAANAYHHHHQQQQHQHQQQQHQHAAAMQGMHATNPWMAAAAAAAQAGAPQYIMQPQMLPPGTNLDPNAAAAAAAAMHAAYSPALMHQLSAQISQMGLGGGYMTGNPHAYGQPIYPAQMMQMQMSNEQQQQQSEALNPSQSVSSGSGSNEDHSSTATGYQQMYQQK